METALHQLVLWDEKALDQQETALGVFLDIEGVFNNTCYDTMCGALVRHGGDYTIVRWITATLEGRVAVATLNWFFYEGCDIQDLPTGRCAVTASMVPDGG